MTVFKKIKDYWKTQKEQEQLLRLALRSQADGYQSCHGDFAYYPDVFFGHREAGRTAPQYRCPV